MNKTMESFYLSVATYAGLKLDENNNLVNLNDKLGAFTLDNKPMALPYRSVLANPDGRNIFHPLNENFATPTNAQFNLFKSKLTFELNLRFASLMFSLIRVCSDTMLQQRIKSPALVDMIASIGETDMTSVENLLRLIKACQNDSPEAFLFDIYLKRNGEIDGVPYTAVGKLNFYIYAELQKSLEVVEGRYTVQECKLRKKDVLALTSIMQAVFPEIGDNKYEVGTDHKPFRMFNALLLTSYQVAKRLNDVAKMLEEVADPSMELETVTSDLEWSKYLETLYGMTNEIRLIPDQTNAVMEGTQLKLNEPKNIEPVTAAPMFQTTSPAPVRQPAPQVPMQAAPPVYQPQPQPQQQPMVTAPVPGPVGQPVTRSASDIVKNAMYNRGYLPGMPQMPGYPQAMIPGMHPAYPQPVMQPQYQPISMMAPGYVQPAQPQGYMPGQVMPQPVPYPGMIPGYVGPPWQ